MGRATSRRLLRRGRLHRAPLSEIFRKNHPGQPLPYLAVHVHHGLRGARGDRDAAHAEAFCREHEIPFRCLRVEVDPAAGPGLEAAARKARREVWAKLAAEARARAIVLAHTRDDQAETVLMRLFEGSGIRGLAGMRRAVPLSEPHPPGASAFTILRPMLSLSREEIRGYLRARGAEWVEDETNADEGRLRNLLRNRVIPSLEDALGMDVQERIVAAAHHLSGAAEVLDAAARAAAEKYLADSGGGITVCSLDEVREMPPALRTALWRIALERVCDRAAGGKRRPLERLCEGVDGLVMEGGPSASLDLPGGAVVRRIYDELVFGPFPPPEFFSGEEVPLACPGRTYHAGLGVSVEAELFSGDVSVLPSAAVLLDADLLPSPWVVRNRREGDRFRPEGKRKPRKLKDYFIEEKIPRAERDGIPLLVAGGEVAWVVGHGISENFRCREGTRNYLRLSVHSAPAGRTPA
ncbi:MAG: tRNA lysidine(34) synthetase TilS [bacterium]|nr:tRNA lysidine(34) synthetase TilS [bacterium]